MTKQLKLSALIVAMAALTAAFANGVITVSRLDR